MLKVSVSALPPHEGFWKYKDNKHFLARVCVGTEHRIEEGNVKRKFEVKRAGLQSSVLCCFSAHFCIWLRQTFIPEGKYCSAYCK